MAERARKTRQKLTFRVAAVPRNPFAVLARQRVAGAHRKQAGAARAAARQALRRDGAGRNEDDGSHE